MRNFIRGKKNEPIQARINPPRDAEGVAYIADAAAPGLKFFRCDPLRANLSQGGCAQRWREAQAATGQLAERFQSCRGCAVGASHAGEDFVRYSPLYGVSICPRCRRGTTRMIGGRVCVSCYNRAREIQAGKNARGNTPVELLANAPRPVEFYLVVNGRARRARVEAVDLVEPILHILRTTKGEVAFGFAAPRTLRQGRLF